MEAQRLPAAGLMAPSSTLLRKRRICLVVLRWRRTGLRRWVMVDRLCLARTSLMVRAIRRSPTCCGQRKRE